ncbi:uncharacterized protein LOC133182990 [Saccostrea echinata]|uniref:uncharacterized protein LOC133182990 n=1 Tax=Saccostrea echinata TaxID=191078 RepID=UPI002A7EECC0|nr:uncharacterized protein LOC133182990 [Saccostrea echinata]
MGKLFGAASLPMMACIALLIGAIFQILGFAAPYWAFDGTYDVGLWRLARCQFSYHVHCYRQDHVEYFTSDWLKVVRAFESLGIIFMVLPLIIIPVYMYVSLGLYYKFMMMCTCVSSLASALSIIIGVSVYSVNVTLNDWEISWCLYICIVAFVATLLAFLILIVAACSKRPPELKQIMVPDHSTLHVHPTKPRFVMIADYSYPA